MRSVELFLNRNSPNGLSQRLVAFVFGLLFSVVGLVFAVGSWGAYWLDTDIARNGRRAEGHLTKKSMLRAADGDSDFTVDYWFTLPSGERVEAHRTLHHELWQTLSEGSTFVVLYSAGNPRRNFPLGSGVTSLGLTVFASVLGTVFAIFGLLLLSGALRRKRTASERTRGTPK